MDVFSIRFLLHSNVIQSPCANGYKATRQLVALVFTFILLVSFGPNATMNESIG